MTIIEAPFIHFSVTSPPVSGSHADITVISLHSSAHLNDTNRTDSYQVLASRHSDAALCFLKWRHMKYSSASVAVTAADFGG